VAFDVLEEEGGAAGLASFRFAYAVGDLGDFQDGIGFGFDAL